MDLWLFILGCVLALIAAAVGFGWVGVVVALCGGGALMCWGIALNGGRF